MKKLEEMVSAHCYEEFSEKVKFYVGEEAFPTVFPAIKKAVEEGSRETRELILIGWLGMDSCRVCSYCGEIMEEGWYLVDSYACSDECAAISEGITMEQFKKWTIYKDDIKQYLVEEGKERSIYDLTQEECDDIIETFFLDRDYCYTEWY